jgi:hypothetical protein
MLWSHICLGFAVLASPVLSIDTPKPKNVPDVEFKPGSLLSLNDLDGLRLQMTASFLSGSDNNPALRKKEAQRQIRFLFKNAEGLSHITKIDDVVLTLDKVEDLVWKHNLNMGLSAIATKIERTWSADKYRELQMAALTLDKDDVFLALVERNPAQVSDIISDWIALGHDTPPLKILISVHDNFAFEPYLVPLLMEQAEKKEWLSVMYFLEEVSGQSPGTLPGQIGHKWPMAGKAASQRLPPSQAIGSHIRPQRILPPRPLGAALKPVAVPGRVGAQFGRIPIRTPIRVI